jgi:hypothetical protein
MRSTLPHVDLQRPDKPGHIAISFEINALQQFGASAGVLGKNLRVPLRQEPGFGGAPLMVSGILKWSGDPYGLVIPAQVWTWNMQHVFVPVTDEALLRIEQRRAGDQAVFDLYVTVLARVEAEIVALESAHPGTFVIPREEWAKILAMLGHGVRRLVELPPAPEALGGAWDDASRQIWETSRRLAVGDAGGAMSEGRTALEGLVKAVGQAAGRPFKPSDNLGPYADRIIQLIADKHVYRGGDALAVLASTIRLAKDVFGLAADSNHRGFSGSDRRAAELGLGLITSMYTYLARFPLEELRADEPE